MRLWRKRQEDEGDYEPRSRRQAQSLKVVAERILAKKMRSDPEYGLQVAERLLKVATPEAKTLKDMLEELGETKELLAELSGPGQAGGLLATVQALLTSGILEQVSSVIAGGKLQQPEITQGQQAPALPTPAAPQGPHIGDLLQLLDMEAEEAFGNLPPEWKKQLAGVNYTQFVGLLISFVDDPTWGELTKLLLSQEKKSWVINVLRLCEEEVKNA